MLCELANQRVRLEREGQLARLDIPPEVSWSSFEKFLKFVNEKLDEEYLGSKETKNGR